MIVAYQGSFNGHVVVVFGYNEEEPGGPYLCIHDPLNGSFLVPYDVSGMYSGGAIWSDTILLNANPLTFGGMSIRAFEDFHHIEYPEFLNYIGPFDAGHLDESSLTSIPLPPKREADETDLFLVGPERK